ncbi:hypothetical protein M5689_000305 [Euphorbia peplus]|nr:hypothetical protein M5689_000305 [Euphorbia peplus]
MGYDSTTDDYKVVRVPKNKYKDSRNLFVEVFSQKSCTWSNRKIPKNFTYQIPHKRSIYTRNCLHWIGRSSNKRESIVYFDMVEERLDRLNVPCQSESIFNYKDSIAIIDCKNLWVLVDYNGMKSSWKKFELPKFKFLDIEGSDLIFCNECFTRDGKLLILLEQGGLRTYDLEDGYVRNVDIRGDHLIYEEDFKSVFDASPYVESLVSPRWYD